jgi:hypothetical protein
LVSRRGFAKILREHGMGRADSAEPLEWKQRADAAIKSLAASGARFTAEDVRRIAGDPSHPNALGARIFEAARKGQIRRVGTTRAQRVGRRMGTLAEWMGTAKAEPEQQALG